MKGALLGFLLGGIYPVVVSRIIDGDTLVAEVQLRPGLTESHIVRLPCGNAAELRADGGQAAKVALSEALRVEEVCSVTQEPIDCQGGFCAVELVKDCHPKPGAGLSIRTEWKHEKYGRLLGDPLRADGGSICGELLDAGVLRRVGYER